MHRRGRVARAETNTGKRVMQKSEIQGPQARRRPWRLVALGTLLQIPAGAASFWWLSEAQNASAGKPRLMVDRTEVDLGHLPFNAPAKVVFTLTNAGGNPLELSDNPPVRAVKGC